jgi:hypothetical protein
LIAGLVSYLIHTCSSRSSFYFQIWSEDGKLLCSDVTNNSVYLITEAEADAKNTEGDWSYCVAWDCTPDELEVAPEDAEFLNVFET